MRVKHTLLLLALGLVLGFAAKSHAEELNLDFTLVNSTGYSIKEVYVAPSASTDWGDDILSKPLKDGQSLKITFHPKATATKWDISIVWEDCGKSVVWHGYKLTDIEKITLLYDEKAGTTTAKTE